MGVINSPLVEGRVFSEEVNKKEVTVNGANSNKKSVRITIILHTLFASVPSMALILLVKVQSRVFTAKCSEPQVGTSNGMDEGSGVTKFLSLRTET